MSFIVLGIESSCDDTGVSVVRSDKQILSNIVISQLKEHQIYQGVVPEIAARSHMQNLRQAAKSAIEEARISLSDISAIAVTAGPGLIGGVITGAMFAKGVAATLGKPIIPINHLEGHILTARLVSTLEFPYLALLVSGGHCQFIAALGIGRYKILGETLDDAVGEAFDKTAKLLSLGFPGGPAIERMAAHGAHNAYNLPLSMTERGGCDLSFSGLKTAVRRIVSTQDCIDDKFTHDICASFQYTVGEILSKRAINAIKMFNEYAGLDHNKNFVLAGGVASNMYLRQTLEKAISKYGFRLTTPQASLCTDNAAMIAWAGIERMRLGLFGNLNFVPVARWSLDSLV